MKPTDARIDVLGELFVVGWAGFGEAVRDGIRPGLLSALRRLDEANAVGVPGMTVDGDVLEDAVRAGMTVLHGPDLHAWQVAS